MPKKNINIFVILLIVVGVVIAFKYSDFFGSTISFGCQGPSVYNDCDQVSQTYIGSGGSSASTLYVYGTHTSSCTGDNYAITVQSTSSGTTNLLKTCSGGGTTTTIPSGSCTDTDGTNIFNKGVVNFGGSTYTDYCYDSTSVLEYYCSGSSMVEYRYNCPTNCNDGKCVETQITCSDTDSGNNKNVKGTLTTSTGVSKTDYCATSNQLIEYYCNNNANLGYSYISYNCDCSNGICVSYPTCSDGKITGSCVCRDEVRTSGVCCDSGSEYQANSNLVCCSSNGMIVSSVSQCPNGQECTPEEEALCSEGKWKTCQSDGTWGECVEPECQTFAGAECSKDEDCCGDFVCMNGHCGNTGTGTGATKTLTWTEYYSTSDKKILSSVCVSDSECPTKSGYEVSCITDEKTKERIFDANANICEESTDVGLGGIVGLISHVPDLVTQILIGKNVCEISSGIKTWFTSNFGTENVGICIAESTSGFGKFWDSTLNLIANIGIPPQFVLLVTLGILILLMPIISNIVSNIGRK